MAIDFPASPTPGQVYENYYWDNSKQAWRSNNTTHMSVITSTTAPTGAVNGDMWFNSTDGTMYIYYNNGITSQWVEFKANSYLGSTLSTRVDQLEVKSPNYIINGAFDIWQRGTSFGASTAYFADRWTTRASNQTITASTDVPDTRFKYSARMDFTNTYTSGFRQYIEASNAKGLTDTVTVSFWAKNASGSRIIVLTVGYAASGVDNFATLTGTSSTTISPTSSWVRYSATLTINDTVRTNGAFVQFVSGSGTAGDAQLITGVQLEVGSTATAFRRNANSIQAELAACQRYYWRWAYQSAITTSGTAYPCYAWSATDVRLAIPHPVEMRKNPVTTLTGAANFAIFMAGTSVGASAGSIDWSSPNSTHYIFTVTGRTAGQAGWVNLNGAGGYLEFNAEL